MNLAGHLPAKWSKQTTQKEDILMQKGLTTITSITPIVHTHTHTYTQYTHILCAI